MEVEGDQEPDSSKNSHKGRVHMCDRVQKEAEDHAAQDDTALDQQSPAQRTSQGLACDETLTQTRARKHMQIQKDAGRHPSYAEAVYSSQRERKALFLHVLLCAEALHSSQRERSFLSPSLALQKMSSNHK